MLQIKLIILVLLANLICVNCQRQPSFQFPSTGNSEQCRIQHTGRRGVCQRFSLCQSAQNDYRNRRIQPTICYFDRSDPIVCCAQQPVTITTKSPVLSSNERISETKCAEYYPPRYSIVGGTLTKKDEFPYMVAIGWRRFDDEFDFSCGGFLVDKRFVITAAHCTNLGGARPDIVRIGADNLKSNEYPNIRIQKIFVHPSYNDQQTYNDIAIMQLRQEVNILPACLWQTNQIDGFTHGDAIGYGDTQFGGRRSDDLLKVNLQLYNTQQCQPFHKPQPEFPRGIITSQLCAGDPSGVKDTCQGDSGGPLIIKSSYNRPYIVGLTSFGTGCAGTTPSIYTRISSYLDWIESVVWPQR